MRGVGAFHGGLLSLIPDLVIGTSGTLSRTEQDAEQSAAHWYHRGMTRASLARFLRLHPARLIAAPRVEVISTNEREIGLAVHGLVCGVCAARTEAALLATPGVDAACVDLDAGTARVTMAHGAPVSADAMQRSLERVVVAMPLRRGIERMMTAGGSRRGGAPIAGGRGR